MKRCRAISHYASIKLNLVRNTPDYRPEGLEVKFDEAGPMKLLQGQAPGAGERRQALFYYGRRSFCHQSSGHDDGIGNLDSKDSVSPLRIPGNMER